MPRLPKNSGSLEMLYAPQHRDFSGDQHRRGGGADYGSGGRGGGWSRHGNLQHQGLVGDGGYGGGGGYTNSRSSQPHGIPGGLGDVP